MTLWLLIRIILYIFIGICILVGIVKLIQDEELSKPAFIFAVLAFIVTLIPIGNNAEDYTSASTDYQTMSTPSPYLPYQETSTLEPEIPEQEYQLPSLEYILLGTWRGEYTAGQGRTSLSLIITEYRNDTISAYFYFSAHPENPNVPSGIYSMSGSISDDMVITLTGQEWIVRPGTFGFINILGNLDINNMVISSNEASLSVSKVSNDTELRHNIAIISNEGYLTSIAPWRLDGVNGFMINNDFSTLRGRGFPQGFVATSATNSYHQVISVNNISPFEIRFNLHGDYSTIRGRVGFDDITPSGNDGFMGVAASRFVGDATVTFLSGDDVLENGVVNISTTDFPQFFELDIEGVSNFVIRFDFPWINQVFENFPKFFNLIDVTIE